MRDHQHTETYRSHDGPMDPKILLEALWRVGPP